MSPLISVIIPSANRPQYLPRAVNSALAGMNPGDIEVIVVPNGPDDSWRETLLPFDNNHSVRVICIEEANANIARNAGLAEARGEFIRFLDDDDYLIKEGAAKQYELIRSTGVDVISGSVKLIDEKGKSSGIWRQPDIDDFCTAILGPTRNCLPTAHVYRRSSLNSTIWNPATIARQDVEWLLNLCVSMEVKWHKIRDVVGIWQQHPDQRVSSKININEINKITVPMLLKAYDSLRIANRLNDSRKQAVALGLWGLIVKAFLFDPLYWSQVARMARKIHPTRPLYAKYNLPVIRQLNPLLIQWLILPKRWSFYLISLILQKFHMRYKT